MLFIKNFQKKHLEKILLIPVSLDFWICIPPIIDTGKGTGSAVLLTPYLK